jgi:hypothetical protein
MSRAKNQNNFFPKNTFQARNVILETISLKMPKDSFGQSYLMKFLEPFK